MSPLPDLPQELVDQVVFNVDDARSLKACCLAGSTLRDPSQRVLFHTLRISSLVKPKLDVPSRSMLPPYREYRAACTLLEESPHIAGYVRRLSIRIQRNSTPSHFESLRMVLEKLDNVYWFRISGDRGLDRWDDMHPEVLLDFLSRQRLRELHVTGITGIPPVVFLQAAPLLAFGSVKLKSNVPVPSASAITDLILLPGSEDVYTLLGRPQFTETLRRVALEPQNVLSRTLAAATTLEYIHFICFRESQSLPFVHPETHKTGKKSVISTPLTLPLLPALRFLDVFFAQPQSVITSFLHTITFFLTSKSCPVLEAITITFGPMFLKSDLPPAPDADAIFNLDAALSSHPAKPLIHWRMTHRAEWASTRQSLTVDAAAEHYAAFANLITRGMPRASVGRLIVEKYEEATVFDDEWPLRRP